ncbi:MAG: phosphoribosylamine--glycine ligase [Bacteroidales bacterium]|nr:phosphoribosylamine--glycine ligase [Bacteroidales bacterium]
MNVLLIGSGGREHALAWKISQSPLLQKLFIASGNAGTMLEGENVSLGTDNFRAVGDFCLSKDINMLVVGPEAPLVNGIHDFFSEEKELRHISVIGPVRKAAMLEGSKDFAKEFMKKNNIPTAAFKTFGLAELEEGKKFLKSMEPPFVLKADGLAAGKGVIICNDIRSAEEELSSMLEGRKFGAASEKVVIEQFLKGIEISVFVLTDGQSYVLLPPAKDYKRAGEGDSGPNTGGMGSVSGVPFADSAFMSKVEERIIQPTLTGLNAEGITYKGFIFFGLMNVGGDPYVIEYNVRMGDPEAESVIPRIKTDLIDLFQGVVDNTLKEKRLEVDSRFCAAVFLVAGGYPGNYEKGHRIQGFSKLKDSLLFHAGTTVDPINHNIITNGGRVIAVSSFGNTLEEALDTTYRSVSLIRFKDCYFRSDIGKDLLSL